MVERYAHLVDEMRKDAATKMDATLEPAAVNLTVKSQYEGELRRNSRWKCWSHPPGSNRRPA